MVKYYQWIIDGYYKQGGMIYAQKGISTSAIKDATEIIGLEKIIFTLKDGNYMHYHTANIGANLVSKELKSLIEEFIPADYPLEFLPVKIHSKEYGDREYYVLHFRIIFDVIDPENTIYVPVVNSIIKVCLKSEKVKDLDIFNSRPYINDIYISERLYKAIKKNKLDKGIDFNPVRCV